MAVGIQFHHPFHPVPVRKREMLPVRTPETFMKVTLAIAEDAMVFGEFPIAAILVLGDEIVARASTAEEREGCTFVHTEYAVLAEADTFGLSYSERHSAILYTNLEPCLMCMGAAMSFFLGEIYYGLESPGAGAGKKPIYPGTNFQRSPAACLGRRALIFSRPTSV